LESKKERLCLWEEKILRRPMACESRAFAPDAKARFLHSLLQFDASLLRMTVFNTRSTTNLTTMGESRAQSEAFQRYPDRFKKLVFPEAALSPTYLKILT
jgi:hypothetical protein